MHTHTHTHTHTHRQAHSAFVYWHRERVSVCIERRAVSEPSSPAHPLLHPSFSLSDISPFSSNHFLPFGPLFFLMQLSLIPPFLPLSLAIPLFLPLPSFSSHWYFTVLLCRILDFFSCSGLQHYHCQLCLLLLRVCSYLAPSPLFWSLVISLP